MEGVFSSIHDGVLMAGIQTTPGRNAHATRATGGKAVALVCGRHSMSHSDAHGFSEDRTAVCIIASKSSIGSASVRCLPVNRLPSLPFRIYLVGELRRPAHPSLSDGMDFGTAHAADLHADQSALKVDSHPEGTSLRVIQDQLFPHSQQMMLLIVSAPTTMQITPDIEAPRCLENFAYSRLPTDEVQRK